MPAQNKYQEISASLSDFVQEMALAIASSKKQLDRASIETLKELSEKNIEVPIIKQKLIGDKVQEEVSYIKVSALSLGMKPTFYEFSETTIEVSMDLSIQEEINTNSRRKRKSLFVNTKNIRSERRFESKINAFSKLKINMVPVPPPNNMPDIIQIT